MAQQPAYSRMQIQLNQCISRLKLWHDSYQEKVPVLPGNFFAPVASLIREPRSVRLCDLVETLNDRLAGFHIELDDPAPDVTDLAITPDTLLAMFSQATWEAAIALDRVGHIEKMPRVVRVLVDVLEDHATVFYRSVDHATLFLENYLDTARQTFQQQMESLVDFNAKSAGRSAALALRKMGGIYEDLPGDFAMALVSNHAIKAGHNYIDRLLERKKFMPDNHIDFVQD